MLCTLYSESCKRKDHAKSLRGYYRKDLKEQGFNIVEMWECDLKKELEENEEMRCYFEEYDLVDPLQPRDAFFGGSPV